MATEGIKDSSCKLPTDNIDIFCRRIIAKKILQNEPILFNVKQGKQVPIDICVLEDDCPAQFEDKVANLLLKESYKLEKIIENDASTVDLINANENLAKLICSLKDKLGDCRGEAKCIEYTRFMLCCEPEEEIICNHKICITIKFKVFLLIKFCGCKLYLLELPCDDSGDFCFGKDVIFPIIYENECVYKELDIDPISKTFILKICIKLKCFEGKITHKDLENILLQSITTLNNIKIKYDITPEPCKCGNRNGLVIKLFVTADIGEKLGIDQDICIKGSITVLKIN